MMIHVLKSKIAYAVITEANLLYEGSITIPENLLQAADLVPGEKVQILNINNGQRFETYTIKGEAGSKNICMNGPAARLGVVGDKIMIISYALMDPEEARQYSPKIFHLDEHNTIKN